MLTGQHITGDIKVGHLRKIVNARFTHISFYFSPCKYCFQSYFYPLIFIFIFLFFFFSVTALFYLEDSRRVREREKRVHARGRESPRESALAPPFICFFLHLGLPYANWA